ncbi:MAG: hypothetical protein ABEK03_08995 [Candidatus Bipolaricaulia bacterium]
MVKYVCLYCGRDWYTAVSDADQGGRCQDCNGPLRRASELFQSRDDEGGQDDPSQIPPSRPR